MEHDDIDASNFVDARAAEIQKLEETIQNTRKKTQLFQRLPFHKRRRTKSCDSRRTPLKHTRRRAAKKVYEYPLLKTHVWFAKRFEMVHLFNSVLPLNRREKSDKFIYKSEERGYIFDESYKDIRVYERNEDKKFNNFSLYEVHTIRIEDDNDFLFCDFILTEKFLITVSYYSKLVDEYFCNFVKIADLDCCLSVMKGSRHTFDSGIYQDLKRLESDIDSFIINLIEKKNETKDFLVPYLIIPKKNDLETCKIFISRSNLMKIWQLFYNKGFIPISINELLRLSLENKKLIFPFDYPDNKLYKIYEESVFTKLKEKYERTPKSKRINYEKLNIQSPFFLPEIKNVKICFFEADKGVFERLSILYREEDIIGYVVRGSYCFSIGKCRGVCVINDGEKVENIMARNINTNVKSPIKILEDNIN